MATQAERLAHDRWLLQRASTKVPNRVQTQGCQAAPWDAAHQQLIATRLEPSGRERAVESPIHSGRERQSPHAGLADGLSIECAPVDLPAWTESNPSALPHSSLERTSTWICEAERSSTWSCWELVLGAFEELRTAQWYFHATRLWWCGLNQDYQRRRKLLAHFPLSSLFCHCR